MTRPSTGTSWPTHRAKASKRRRARKYLTRFTLTTKESR